MASVNKVILVGNLGRDPEYRTFPNSEGGVTNFSMATTFRTRDRATGEYKDEVEWHNIVLFNRLAEVAQQYLRKGSPVYIEGRIRTRKWQDKNTGQDRYTTEIVAESLQLLGSRADTAVESGFGDQVSPAVNTGRAAMSAPAVAPASPKPVAPRPAPVAVEELEDDVPF